MASPSLIKPLRFAFSILTGGDFCWNCAVLLSLRLEISGPHEGKRDEGHFMHDLFAGYLLLVPVALSVAFLLWVLWHFHKDEKR
jgi:hypothetical protein